jgi:two-component system, NtrC family, response regulator AtoC
MSSDSDSESDLEPETEPVKDDEGPSGRLRLLALWDEEYLVFPLPDAGTVTVGRAEDAALRIGDPSISRRHVRLHVGKRLRVEDLRSANGTSVRGRPLSPGETVEVSVGDVIELGRTMLFVQRAPPRVRPVQVYSHEYFEARVDEECQRPRRRGAGFALLRTRDGGSPGTLFEERLLASVGPGDVLARYGPGEHGLLWMNCAPVAAEKRAAALRASLQQLAPTASVGLACSPRDGRSAPVLLERANAGARGVGRVETPVPVAFGDGAMKNLGPILERVAASSMSVLVTGETGVGKGILAAELHRKSRRAAGPFVSINCAALPETLREGELFGHERGAYSGADKAKPGLIETADGGTLVLDEVGELSLPGQASLLKVLDDFDVLRLGGVKARRVDVRLITCTNRDLEAEVERGAFREDLYFRLAKIPLFVPPLRERTQEIEELARAFAAEASAREGTSVPVISPEALAVLRSNPWPGNVRELRSAIEWAMLQCTDGVIRPEHLPAARLRTTVYAPAPVAAAPSQGREGAERQRIADALAQCGGNQRRAAELLGIGRRTLVTRLKELNLPRPRSKRD